MCNRCTKLGVDFKNYVLKLDCNANIVLVSQSAEIDERVAHTSQCCIDADSRLLCYFLETQLIVVTHEHHFALTFREQLDE